MGLTWIVVAIIGLAGLALCIVAVVVAPMSARRQHLRPLAHTDRLSALPEYVRAIRLRTLATLVAVALLVVAFGGALIAGARPTGLPTAAIDSGSGQPEDVMLCIAGSSSDPAVTAALRYVAAEVKTFDTQRIGLTTPNQRMVPLTRDYAYVSTRLATLAQQTDRNGLAPPVSYSDYAGSVEDLVALCASGFPGFEATATQRRSVIYVGPAVLGDPADPRPALFTAAALQQLVTTAGIQVNAVTTGAPTDSLASLVRDTGGQSFTADSDVAGHLRQIRSHPPAPADVDTDRVATDAAESPDVPILVALAAAIALAAVAVVQRR